MTTTTQTPKQALLRQLPDGTIQALSSNMRTVYTLVNRADGSWSCDCPAGRAGRNCYHVTTARVRYASYNRAPSQYRRPRAQASDLYN